MRWLYLHFPSLQLDAIEQAQSGATSLSGKSNKEANKGDDKEANPNQPLIIISSRHNAVTQFNHSAKALGITPGMGLATAIALAGDIKIVEHHPETEITRLHELAQWLYQIVADIALFEPDGLALEVSGMLSLYDDIDNYWQAIQDVLQRQQVSYARAVAQTPLAARLLARDGHKPLNHDNHLINRQLGRLPVERLELPQRQIEQLQRVGINHLSQLLHISSKALGRRFGLEVLNYLGKLKGDLRQVLNFFEPPLYFSKFLELFHEIEQSQVLLFPLKRMVQELDAFLRGRELMITELTLTLHYRDGEPMVLTIGSASGEYQADKWLALITLHLERSRLSAPVTGITLSSGELIEKNTVTDDLFSGSQGKMTPAQLISLLQARVGKERIVGIELRQDHRPEFAFGYAVPQDTRVAGPDPGDDALAAIPSAFLPKTRPLILLDEPQPLDSQYTVLYGPERVRSAWWGKQAVYRDYFIARDKQGAVCWLFTEPEGGWFLHGYFC